MRKLCFLFLVYLLLPFHIYGQWSFLTGNQTVYTAPDYTIPYSGGIFGHRMVIDTTDTYIYIFGGNIQAGRVNQIWKFDITQNLWEFVSGSQSFNIRADYTTPYPGSVAYPGMVIDGANRNLYVFGGEGFDESSRGRVDDNVLIN